MGSVVIEGEMIDRLRELLMEDRVCDALEIRQSEDDPVVTIVMHAGGSSKEIKWQ